MVQVSVIIPVYNVERYLRQCLDSLRAQTLKDIEIICVDDGSTDKSVAILAEYAARDSRIRVIRQDNKGAGAARNLGLTKASGAYVIWLDGDDYFSHGLLEHLYTAAEQHQADICACNFSRFTPDGMMIPCKGVHMEYLPEGKTVFNYQDCPERILNVVNPTPWNKLYRTDFVRRNGLKYEEISSTNDITFAAVSVAYAARIAVVQESLIQYRIGHSGTISATKSKNLNNICIAVDSTIRQLKALPYYDAIRNAVRYFVVDTYLFALSHYVKDFSTGNVQAFYEHIQETFNADGFDEHLRETLRNDTVYLNYMIVRKQRYDVLKQLIARKLIVAMTTYPGRIATITQVLKTVMEQKRQPDQIVLYLAEEQFPNKKKDLPHDLRKLIGQGRVALRWCDDLKPHKKYFYAFQEFPDDCVVTLDDDLLYKPDLLENLYRSYLLYPHAVSAARAHLMVCSEDGRFLSYRYWVKETDECIYEPTMQLLATGGAGALYPPHLLRTEFLDPEAILNVCLWADDLWLKAMELVSDVPVVLAQPYAPLCYLPHTQENGLYHQNINQNQNDVQWANIQAWTDQRFYPNVLQDKFMNSGIGVSLIGTEELCRHYDGERQRLRRRPAVKRNLGPTVQDVLNSRTYRAGLAVTFIPRKIRGCYRLLRQHGVKYTVRYALSLVRCLLNKAA